MMKNSGCQVQLLFFFFFTLSIGAPLLAQTAKIDSLKQQLLNHSEADTNKINLILSICKESLKFDNYKEQLMQYTPRLLVLSEKLGFKKGMAYSFYYMSMTELKKNDSVSEDHYLQKALKLMQELKDKRGIAACYERMGKLKGTHNAYWEAIQFYSNAISIKKEIGDLNGIADCYSWIGGIYSHTANYEKALENYIKALKIAESTNCKSEICECNISIGVIFYEQKKFRESIAYMNKALMVEGDRTSKLNLSYIYNNLAISYEKLNNHSTSLLYHFKSLKLNEEMKDKSGMAVSYNNISGVYSSIGKTSEALKYILTSIALSEETNDRKGLTYSYIGAGDCYKERNSAIAYGYYLKALKTAREINYKTEVREAYEHLFIIAEETGDYQKALVYHRNYVQIKDSILNEESLKQSSELSIHYETEKKEKEILLLTKEQELKDKNLKEQRLIRIGLIVLLVLLLILSYVLYNRSRFKQKANLLLEKQKEEIRNKNILITDSIEYAKTIQDAVLPDEKYVSSILPNHFILYKPKDIVSGDFYWITKKENKIICVVADCTEHSVAGAFISLLGHNMLENIKHLETILNPSSILAALAQQINTRFSKDGKVSPNGMDISVISIDIERNQLEYAGVKNALCIVRAHHLFELKADNVALGTHTIDQEPFNYTNHVFQLQKGDMLYLFSDGFQNQEGGLERKKFFYQPFKDLLLSISNFPVEKQKDCLNSTIKEWMGTSDQIDDILVMGIKY